MKHSILIVDDNPEVTGALGELLKQAGFEVQSASNSREAYKATSATDFSLVITDLRMETGGEQDGLKLVRFLRRYRPGMPVFVLTASASQEAATEWAELQVRRYLGKPIRAAKLLRAVCEFVDDFYAPVG